MSPYQTNWPKHGLDYGAGKNAFHAARESRPEIELTPEQKKAEAHRVDMLSRYHARQALKAATRVSTSNFHIASPAESQANLDTTRRIVGKSNGARSQ